MVIIIIGLLTEKKSISLKQIMKMLTFQFNFVQDVETEKVSLKENVYDFLVD